MRLFGALYDRVLRWSKHPHAPRYLGALSFAESSFFPIPPDVLLAPMVLAQRERAWYYAGLTTAMSVLGGVAGYLIGQLLFEQLGEPLLSMYHAEDAFAQVKQWFLDYGVWIVVIAGFTPLPYKVFTIASGVMAMAVVPFVLASLFGRGARFFLVAGLIRIGGEGFERGLRTWIDTIGWSVVALVAVLFFLTR